MNMDDDFDEIAHQKLIHIHKVVNKGRKYFTKVRGIPECFDLNKILKFWKNNFQTNGCLRLPESKEKEKEKGEKDEAEKEQKCDIVLNGDHRKAIKEFLIYMGISDEENIRIHGAS